jgi:hypothetical protein
MSGPHEISAATEKVKTVPRSSEKSAKACSKGWASEEA